MIDVDMITTKPRQQSTIDGIYIGSFMVSQTNRVPVDFTLTPRRRASSADVGRSLCQNCGQHTYRGKLNLCVVKESLLMVTKAGTTTKHIQTEQYWCRPCRITAPHKDRVLHVKEQCTKCKQWKFEHDFSPRADKLNGLHSHCKTCRKNYMAVQRLKKIMATVN